MADNQDVMQLNDELRSKLNETEEQVQQWVNSYSNLQFLLIDFGKQIEGEIYAFDEIDCELSKEKYTHRYFKPMLDKLNDNFEVVLCNAEVTMSDVYQFQINSNDSNEFKIAALLNELKSSYKGFPNLSPKDRLEKLMDSPEFASESMQRRLNVDVRALGHTARNRILTIINTEKRNGT